MRISPRPMSWLGSVAICSIGLACVEVRLVKAAVVHGPDAHGAGALAGTGRPSARTAARTADASARTGGSPARAAEIGRV